MIVTIYTNDFNLHNSLIASLLRIPAVGMANIQHIFTVTGAIITQTSWTDKVSAAKF